MMEYRTLTLIMTGVIVLLVLVLAALWHASTRRIGELRLALDDTSRSADEARQAAETLGDMARTEERKAKEFFGIIEGIERERDTWQALYRQSSQAAGVAQAWLMRDLSQAVGQANAYAARLRALGQKAPGVNIDPQLRTVLEDFGVTHVSGEPATQPDPPAPTA
jgi:biopolymer transport protein ExbB/TolQ